MVLIIMMALVAVVVEGTVATVAILVVAVAVTSMAPAEAMAPELFKWVVVLSGDFELS